VLEITEVKIKPADGGREKKLKAFATFVIDGGFVVRDCRIISAEGTLLLSMPSRRVTDHCPTCGTKTPLASKFCGECGARLAEGRGANSPGLYADVAHPIDAETRRVVTDAVLGSYRAEFGDCAPEGMSGRLARRRA
jgi:stage V sporulation protein G